MTRMMKIQPTFKILYRVNIQINEETIMQAEDEDDVEEKFLDRVDNGELNPAYFDNLLTLYPQASLEIEWEEIEKL